MASVEEYSCLTANFGNLLGFLGAPWTAIVEVCTVGDDRGYEGGGVRGEALGSDSRERRRVGAVTDEIAPFTLARDAH